MSDIEKRALALLNDVWEERGYLPDDRVSRKDVPSHEALCRAIEQHEAFKQEVGFALSNEWHNLHCGAKRNLDRFRIPIPKPDPLMEVIETLESYMWTDTKGYVECLYKALKDHGLEIVPCK